MDTSGNRIHRREILPADPKRHCWFCGRDAEEAFAREERGPFVPFCTACREAFGTVKFPD